MLFEHVIHDHWKIHQANWEPTTIILFEIYLMVKTYMIPFRMVEFRKKLEYHNFRWHLHV